MKSLWLILPETTIYSKEVWVVSTVPISDQLFQVCDCDRFNIAHWRRPLFSDLSSSFVITMSGEKSKFVKKKGVSNPLPS